MESDEIFNKVAESGLITLNLEEFYSPGERVAIDVKDWLFEELILKEKDFREKVKSHSWETYQGKFVAIFCSADAIVPTWAYMLIASELEPYAKKFIFGTLSELESQLFHQSMESFKPELYQGERVIVKGCSKVQVPDSAYVEIMRKLRPFAQSVFYGEACSAVPLFKKKK